MSIIDYPNGSANANPLALTDGSTQLQVTSGTATQSGVISESGGSFGPEKTGSGTLIYTADNTYTGGTTISAGLLQLGTGGSLSSAGALTIIGGTFDLNGHTQTVGTLSGASGAIQLGSGSLTVTMANIDDAFSGVITGTGSLTKAGIATLTLNGTNTYSGGTTLMSRSLVLGSSSAAGTGPITLAGTAFDTLDYTNGITVANNIVIQNNFAWLTVSDGNGTATQSGTISGSQSLVKFGYGTLVLTGNNTYTGGTIIRLGTLVVSADQNLGDPSGAITFSNGHSILMFGAAFNPNPARAIIVNNTPGLLAAINTNGFDIMLAQGISGSGDLTKTGNGTLTLNAVGTMTGTLDVNQGILRLGVDNALSPSGIAINGGGYGTLDLNNHNFSVGKLFGRGDITLGSGTLTVNGPATWDGRISGTGPVVIANTFSISNANTYTGGTTVTGTGNLSIGVNNTGSIVGSITNNGIVTFNRNDATTFSGAITGTGSVVQADSGTTTLTGTNTYSGGTVINSGALRLGNGGTSGSIVGNVTNNRALIFNRSDATTFAGVVSGTGSVSHSGVGTTTLTGINTYAGATTVSHGTLLVDGSIASSAVTVAGGATLGGSGIVGATSIQSGGTLAAGDAPGAISNLQVNGNLTFQGGALSEDVSAAAADQIIVSGNVSLGGQLVANFAGSGSGHQTFTLLHANGGLSGTFANVTVTGLPAGLNAYVTYDANNAYLRTNHAPVVTTADKTLAPGQSMTLASLINVSDTDGDSMTRYQLYDATGNPSSGHFVVGGQVQSSNITLDITAAQAAQTSFVAGTVADNIQIRVYDGQAWSAADSADWAPFVISPLVNHAPSLTTFDRTLAASQSMTLASLINVSDPDGDAITRYQLYDATGNPASGHFVVNGITQSSNMTLDITAAQAAQTTFVAGTVNDDIQIRAFDGHAWSAADTANWAPFTLGPTVNNPPVVTTANIRATAGQSITLANLISVSDADGDAMTRYQLYDVTSDPNSGHFVINGAIQSARITLDITATQAAQTSFVAGTVNDDIQIRAYDGQAWSAADTANWAPFTLGPTVNNPPLVTTVDHTASPGQSLSLASLISVSDADGDAMTRYQLYDVTSDPSSGHFVVNGVAQSARIVIDLTAAQAAQTSFLTGTVDDDIQIRAFDGHAWSAADTANWSPFHIFG